MTEADAITQDDTDQDADTSGGVCWECGGPCLTYKGSVHGWRCIACLHRYLDDGAAKAAARDRRDRERLARKALDAAIQTSVTANGQRREGGGSALCAAPSSGADRQERAAAPRYVPRRSDDHHHHLTREDT
ncbi:hypothetical protein [Mycobacterium sp. 852014-52450_SCH5900713]|uniref:hypothetical protein n=1 Tax=Mycobacterium sp. 852014-52450_SCH5900713 TaxID=1834116 RepID=UPI001E37ECB4|nr:hypothetical protein [Mycobacterium sp. 852014-52450_SCH5900713]